MGIGSKKSPPISRVNNHQCNNNKKVRIEGSFLEIARSEGLRAVQLGKSLLLRNRACWIHPLELKCAEPGEWLQEQRQLGAPCRVSSDEDYCMECCCKRLWDNLKLKPQLRKVYFCCYSTIVSACVLLNSGTLAGNKLMSGSMGGAHCCVRPPLGLEMSSATYWCLLQSLGASHLQDLCDRMTDWLTNWVL